MQTRTMPASIFACMRGRLFVIAGVTIFPFAFAVAGCATTKLKEQWRDPDFEVASAQRVLVIAVTGREENRQDFEDQFAARLRKEGVEAIPSYGQLSVIGPKNVDAVKEAVARTNANMVLTVRLIQADAKTAVNTSYGYYGPSSFYGYYPHAWTGVYPIPQTYAYTYRTYTTETRVFDMRNDKLIWAATLQSEEPSNFKKAVTQYVDLVVKQMRDNKILAGG